MRKSRRKPFIAIGAGVILLAILFFVLTGNGLWEGKEGSTNSVIEKKKVVFLTKSMDSSFWQSFRFLIGQMEESAGRRKKS